MTANEMKQLFLVLYDKVTNFAAPGYEDAEIDLILNKAQLQFVKSRYTPKGNRYNEGVEQTEKRRKDLSELTKNSILSSSDLSSDQSDVHPNAVMYNLPENFLYALKEEIVIISDTVCNNGKRIPVLPITHDTYNSNIRNPFKKPDVTQAWRLDFSKDVTVASTNTPTTKRHEIIYGVDYTVDTYHIRYIKVPTPISIVNLVDCELDSSVHEEIVDIAVRIATAITNPQEYQIKTAEQVLTE